MPRAPRPRRPGRDCQCGRARPGGRRRCTGEIRQATVDARGAFFAAPELDRAEGGKVERALRNLDELLDARVGRHLDAPLLPRAGDVRAPRLAQPANERVRTAEQQHVRIQRVPAREDRQVLENDGLEERRHELIDRRTQLLQSRDIALGEDPALARDSVQLDAVVAERGNLVGRDAKLGADLVDHGAGPARALVVHRWNLLLAAALALVAKDDDLRVLAAELDDRPHLRVELLDGHRHGGDFLHEFRADEARDRVSAGSSDEDAGGAWPDAGLGLHPAQEVADLLRLPRLVALIVLPDDDIRVVIDDDGFHRCRAHIEPDQARPGPTGPHHVGSPTSGACRLRSSIRSSRSIRSLTCRMNCAAVPVMFCRRGTR